MKIHDQKHQAYIINLERRTDRKINIQKEFAQHKEYEISIFNAIEDKRGSLGLFKSFQAIVQLAEEQNLDHVIICEDDHVFTVNYDKTLFNKQVELGKRLGFDVLLGGMSNVHDAIFANSNLVWVGGFTGLQFCVVYKKFYAPLLSYSLGKNPLDLALGEFSDNIYCCYPAISSQYSYGYSDVTLKNENMNVETYFETCNLKLDRLYKVSQYYGTIKD